MNFLLLVVCLCTLSGCIEEFEADVPAEETSLLVVEGTICSSGLNTFVLSRTTSLNAKNDPQKISNAKVYVRGSELLD